MKYTYHKKYDMPISMIDITVEEKKRFPKFVTGFLFGLAFGVLLFMFLYAKN